MGRVEKMGGGLVLLGHIDPADAGEPAASYTKVNSVFEQLREIHLAYHEVRHAVAVK